MVPRLSPKTAMSEQLERQLVPSKIIWIDPYTAYTRGFVAGEREKESTI
jgi:hypothetical protein